MNYIDGPFDSADSFSFDISETLPLPDIPSVWVLIQAHPDNTDYVTAAIGNRFRSNTGTGPVLIAGAALPVKVAYASMIHLVPASGTQNVRVTILNCGGGA